ncbi:diguanylate cyclase, partial [Ectothiorhodospira haloalkaliphila]
MFSINRSYVRIVLTLVGLMAITATVIGVVSFSGGHKAATDMAAQLQGQIADTVQDRVQAFLERPHVLTHMNGLKVIENPASLDDPHALSTSWLNQLHAFDSMQTIAVGIEEQGNFIGVGRAADGHFTIASRNLDADNHYRVFQVDTQGQPIKTLTEIRNYDARERPWYQAAVQADQAIWSPIYIWAAGTSIGLTAALPIKEADGRLLGVQQAALSLDFISDHLQELAGNLDQKVFIVEPNGLLVGTSATEAVVKIENQGVERVSMLSSTDPFTQAAAQYLDQHIDVVNGLDKPVYTAFEVADQRYFLSVTRMDDSRGLNWVIVTGMPQATLMSNTHTTLRITLGITLAATLAAMLLGVVIARQLVAAERRLTQANQQLLDSNEKLQYVASTDNLTGLMNRRKFLDIAERELLQYERYQRDFSIILMDLDHFKQVNDQYGHNVGDLVLKQTAEILLHCSRKQDAVARWGGEEFILLLPATELDTAVLVAERIRRSIEDYNYESGIKLTGSFGVVSLARLDALDIGALVN